MKSRTKFLFSAVLFGSIVASSSLLLTGCGGDDSGSSNQSNVSQMGEIITPHLPNLQFGSVEFKNGKVLNFTWGIGSAAAHRQGDDEKTFYTMTDRGVNIDCKDAKDIIGIDICNGASGVIFPFPTFTPPPTIFKLRLSDDGKSVYVVDVIPLKDKDGNLITGLSNPLSNFQEIPFDKDGNQLNYNPNGLDTEALAIMKDGSFWIGEEYAPSLVHVSKDGKIIERLVPKGLETELANANYVVKGVLPSIIAKRHPNRGIEGVAISPDEKYLYFTLQSPLDNLDSKAYSKSRYVRMYKMSLTDYNDIKEYAYQLDTPDTFIQDNKNTTNPPKQKDVKISEMTVLENGDVIVLERITKTTKLYKVDFNNAVPVPADKSATLETDATGITPLSKTLIFTTDNYNDGEFPSKIEGMTSLGNGKLILINDNDFGIRGEDTVIKIINLK